jgi:hypothetical protein
VNKKKTEGMEKGNVFWKLHLILGLETEEWMRTDLQTIPKIRTYVT